MTDEILPSFYDENYFEKGITSNYKPYSGTETIFLVLSKVIARIFRPRNLLELGCAYGFLLKYIKLGSQIGIDISIYAITQQRTTNKLLIASASHIPFKSNTFDIVVSFETLEHLTKQQIIQCLHEVKRVGTKWFLFTAPEPNPHPDKDKDQSHINTLYPEEWFEIIEPFNWKYRPDTVDRLKTTNIFKEFKWNTYVFDISNNNI